MAQVTAGKQQLWLTTLTMAACQWSRTLVSVISDTCVFVHVTVKMWLHSLQDQLLKWQFKSFTQWFFFCLPLCASVRCCLCTPSLWPVPAAPSSFMLGHTVLTELQRYRMSSCSIRTQFTLRPADLSELEATNYHHIQLSMVSWEMNSAAASISLTDTDEQEIVKTTQWLFEVVQ